MSATDRKGDRARALEAIGLPDGAGPEQIRHALGVLLDQHGPEAAAEAAAALDDEMLCKAGPPRRA